MFRICKVSDIGDDSMTKFTVDRKDILVGKRSGKLFACDNSCPHRGASLHKGHYKDNNIVCYMHGYEFDVDSGKLTNMKSWKKNDAWVEQNPAWRESGDLIMYDVEVRGDDIYVGLREK